MSLHRLFVAVCCASTCACAHALVRPATLPGRPPADALLVLPGFGYGRAGEQAFRDLAGSIAADGFDLYLPAYVSRGGLEESRGRLQRFIHEHGLARYERVHVFAFIAGGWTFNRLVARDVLPNLTTIVYDRSPFQERAPRIALEELRLLTWLRYGGVVFDVARTAYEPLAVEGVRVGLLVETRPTSFIRRHASAARRQGPYDFACDRFGQRHDDCAYVALDHQQLYARFAEVWPEVRAFIRTGRFSADANRLPPDEPEAGGRR